MTQQMTGFPSIDKPWLKYYSEEAIKAPLPECTVYEYLWDSNKDHLDDTALNYFDRTITFREMFSEIDRCAKALTAIGLKCGDIIIMATVSTPETIYAFYACSLLGIIPNMVDPRTSQDGVRHYIEEVEARCIITIEAAYPKIAKAAEGIVDKIITVSPADSLSPVKRSIYLVSNRLKKQNADISELAYSWKYFISMGKTSTYHAQKYQSEHCCVIVHTGGTTGFPKGVMLSDQNLNVMSLQYRLLGVEVNPSQSFLNIMPPSIAYGIVCGIHMPLSLGLTDVLIPQLDPNKFADLIKKYRPAHIMGVPAHFEQLRSSQKMRGFDLRFFESAGAGGDGIPEQFERNIDTFLVTIQSTPKNTQSA